MRKKGCTGEEYGGAAGGWDYEERVRDQSLQAANAPADEAGAYGGKLQCLLVAPYRLVVVAVRPVH